jgi:hypothetical protein
MQRKLKISLTISALIIVVYFSFWFLVANSMKTYIEKTLQGSNSNFNIANVKISGFPFNFILESDSLSYKNDKPSFFSSINTDKLRLKTNILVNKIYLILPPQTNINLAFNNENHEYKFLSNPNNDLVIQLDGYRSIFNLAKIYFTNEGHFLDGLDINKINFNLNDLQVYNKTKNLHFFNNNSKFEITSAKQGNNFLYTLKTSSKINFIQNDQNSFYVSILASELDSQAKRSSINYEHELILNKLALQLDNFRAEFSGNKSFQNKTHDINLSVKLENLNDLTNLLIKNQLITDKQEQLILAIFTRITGSTNTNLVEFKITNTKDNDIRIGLLDSKEILNLIQQIN